MMCVSVGQVLRASSGRSKLRSGKILRHSVSIDEHEVFSLIHKPVELQEPQPSRFADRVAAWAEDAARRYGDIEEFDGEILKLSPEALAAKRRSPESSGFTRRRIRSMPTPSRIDARYSAGPMRSGRRARSTLSTAAPRTQQRCRNPSLPLPSLLERVEEGGARGAVSSETRCQPKRINSNATRSGELRRRSAPIERH